MALDFAPTYTGGHWPKYVNVYLPPDELILLIKSSLIFSTIRFGKNDLKVVIVPSSNKFTTIAFPNRVLTADIFFMIYALFTINDEIGFCSTTAVFSIIIALSANKSCSEISIVKIRVYGERIAKSNIRYCSLEIIKTTTLCSLVNSWVVKDRFEFCAAIAFYL